jgi:hypothetical protein
MSHLKIGVAQVDITPAIGTDMAGYIRRQGASQGIHYPLYAKTLYLNDGQSELAIITIDSLAVDQTLLDLVRVAVTSSTGLASQNICLAATHTHSGPSGLAVLSFGGGHNDELLALTVPQISASVQQAKDGAFDASLKIGSTSAAGISQNRLHPTQPVDNQLHVLRIEDRQGNLRGVWANFACHPTFLGYDNRYLSADWPGAACAVVEKVVGNDVMVMITNGASGDIHPVYLEQTLAGLERMGQILGGLIITTLGQLQTTGQKLRSHNVRWGIEVETHFPHGRAVTQPAIQLLRQQVSLPFREYDSQKAYDRKIADLCGQLRARGLDGALLQLMADNPGTTYPNPVAVDQTHYDLLAQLNTLAGERLERKRVLGLSQGQTSQEIDLDVLRIDPDLSIFFFPGELSNQIGMSLKAQCGLQDLMIVTYANDYVGYLASAADYPLGGYDVGVSHFTPQAEAILTETALNLIAECTHA